MPLVLNFLWKPADVNNVAWYNSLNGIPGSYRFKYLINLEHRILLFFNLFYFKQITYTASKLETLIKQFTDSKSDFSNNPRVGKTEYCRGFNLK